MALARVARKRYRGEDTFALRAIGYIAGTGTGCSCAIAAMRQSAISRGGTPGDGSSGGSRGPSAACPACSGTACISARVISAAILDDVRGIAENGTLGRSAGGGRRFTRGGGRADACGAPANNPTLVIAADTGLAAGNIAVLGTSGTAARSAVHHAAVSTHGAGCRRGTPCGGALGGGRGSGRDRGSGRSIGGSSRRSGSAAGIGTGGAGFPITLGGTRAATEAREAHPPLLASTLHGRLVGVPASRQWYVVAAVGVFCTGGGATGGGT